MFWKMFVLTIGITLASVNILPEKDITEIAVRIGEYKQITIPPAFPFENIYKKEVLALDDQDNQNDFSNVCEQTPADILFTQTLAFDLKIKNSKKYQDVIVDFEDIKADRRILDTVLFNDKIFILLRENTLQMFDTKINSPQAKDIIIPTAIKDKFIQIGYFVTVDNKLLLVTPFEVFKIEDTKISKLQGYENITDFQSARELFGLNFAVCGISSGVVIYGLNESTLVQKAKLDTQFFQRPSLFISDLAYNKDSSQIFISDLKFGINIVQLNTSIPNLNATLDNRGYRKVGCNVIVYVDGNLYASCNDLFKVRYDSDQKIIDMPNPMFKVNELLVYKGLIVAVGEDLIIKYYNDKLTYKNPEYDDSQRLLFYDNNKYLRANYYGLEVGTFKISYPAITCHTYNESLQGITNAVLKTQAQCSQAYFDKYSAKPNKILSKADTCLYTSPVQFNFWRAQPFNFELVFIIMGVLFLVAGIITTWAIFIFNKEVFLKRTLDMYTNPNIEMKSGTDLPRYDVMVQQKQYTEDSNNISDTGKDIEIDRATHSID